jgi:hypothetical protein
MLNVTLDFYLQSTVLSCFEQFDGRLLIFFTSFQAGKTLSARKWHAAFSPDGCLDIASVLRRIQTGVRFLIFGVFVSQFHICSLSYRCRIRIFQ